MSKLAPQTPQPQQLHDFIGIANYLENIGDAIDKDLLAVAAKRRRNSIVISRQTREKLRALEQEVRRSFGMVLAAIETGDHDVAMEVLESKSAVVALAEDASNYIAERLVAEEPHRLETFHVETDIVEIYRRLNTLTRRIARLSIDAGTAGASTAGDKQAA